MGLSKPQRAFCAPGGAVMCRLPSVSCLFLLVANPPKGSPPRFVVRRPRLRQQNKNEGNERFAECRRQCARVTSALQSSSSEFDVGIRDSGRFEL